MHPTPERQAKLAAKMAEMMGWRVGIEYEDFDPWTDANDAIAFADARFSGLWQKVGHYINIYNAEGRRIVSVLLEPKCPFAHALTLACCRAIPELREMLEVDDG